MKKQYITPIVEIDNDIPELELCAGAGSYNQGTIGNDQVPLDEQDGDWSGWDEGEGSL